MAKKRIVVLGGGTGTFTVLSGLKEYPFELSAIVAMADDGGSTGILRDELGVLPPGDVRQCLVALSSSDRLMRELMNYRFPNRSLRGHSVGNLLLSALEKITGSFDAAVEKTSEILRLQGTVIPATLQKVHLVAHLDTGAVIRGQNTIYEHPLRGLARIALTPHARANPKALAAIRNAHAIVIAPGDLYSSIVPNFLVAGIPAAIRTSRAKRICITNLMNRPNTAGMTPLDFVTTIEQYVGAPLHAVIYNNTTPSAHLLARYAREQETIVEPPKNLSSLPKRIRWVGANLISKRIAKTRPGDTMNRNLIRHNPQRLASLVARLVT